MSDIWFGSLMRACLVGLAIGLLPALTQGAPLSKTLAATGLNPEDLAIMSAAGEKVYKAPQPKVGNQSSWENPKSGSNGTVEIDAVEGNCVILLHKFQARNRPNAQPVRVRWCKKADGAWQLG